jgi:hypothetical protein
VLHIFNWREKLPKDDLGKRETYMNFDGLYVKIYIILTYSAFVGIASWVTTIPSTATGNRQKEPRLGTQVFAFLIARDVTWIVPRYIILRNKMSKATLNTRQLLIKCLYKENKFRTLDEPVFCTGIVADISGWEFFVAAVCCVYCNKFRIYLNDIHTN